MSSMVILKGKDGKSPGTARLVMKQSESNPVITKYAFGIRTVGGVMVSPKYYHCNN